MTSFVGAVLLALASSSHVSCAFPTRAGSCTEGPAVLPSGFSHSQTGKGLISVGGYELSVNDVQLPPDNDQVPFNLYTGDTNNIKIATGSGASDESFFRGFLIRVSGVTSGLPANGTLTLTDEQLVNEDEADAQILPNSDPAKNGQDSTCDLDVAGMCHTGNGDKEVVNGNLQFETVGNYTIEVTIVKTNNGNEGRDNWYYSRFYAEVENPPPSALPTSMPSSSPSSMPSSSPSITTKPSGSPSALPSSMPSGSPSATPMPSVTPQPSATPQPTPVKMTPPVEAPSPTSGGVIVLVASSALSVGVALCFALLGL